MSEDGGIGDNWGFGDGSGFGYDRGWGLGLIENLSIENKKPVLAKAGI